MKRKLMIISLIMISLTGCMGQAAQVSGEVQEEVVSEVEQVTPVEVVSVNSGEMSKYHNATGSIQIDEDFVVVGPTTQGLIESIHVSEGSWVSQGTLLYKIDTELAEHNLNTQITGTQNAITNAEMTYNTALDAAETAQTLYDNDIITKTEYDQAMNGLQAAELNLKVQNDTYESLVKSLEMTISNSYVYAPISGEVDEINIHVGQGSVGRDIVIKNHTATLAKTAVSEQVADTLKIGNSIDVVRNGKSYPGKITDIEATGTPGTNMFMVEIEVNDRDGELKRGHSIEVNYPLEHVANQIIIPRKAILTDAQGGYVFVAGEGVAEKIYIEQGIISDGQVQIIDGLNEGDQVIVKGQSFLRDGDQIIIIED